jgi:hypothetical protein
MPDPGAAELAPAGPRVARQDAPLHVGGCHGSTGQEAEVTARKIVVR